MPTIIQIKRSANVFAPTTSDLLEGELGYSYDKSNNGAGAKLYIEALDSSNNPIIHTLGGKYYTTIIDSATDTNTSNTLVKRNLNGDFTSGNITARLYGTANAAIQLTTPRLINLSGDLEGNVLFDGTSNVSIVANILPNSIVLGTDTSGNYLSNVIAGSGIQITNQGGESATPTVSLSSSGVAAGTYGGDTLVPVITVDTFGRLTSVSNVSINTASSGNLNVFSTINVSGQSSISADNSSDTLTLANTLGIVIGTDAGSDILTFALSNTGVVAATYGSAGNIPVISVDAQGRITSASNIQISTSLGISGNVGSDTISLGNETLSIVGGSGIGTTVSSNTVSIFNTGVVSLSGTSNEVNVSSANGAVQIGLPDNITVSGDLSVLGNLTILGNVTTVGTSSITINDPLIHLANNNTFSDLIDIGFEGRYFDSTFGQMNAGLFRDASDSGFFKLFSNVSASFEGQSTINTADPGYTVATLVANLKGGTVSNLTANISVSDGGTGRGILTTNSVLYGLGTSAVGLATGTSGQILQINSSGIPEFAGIDGGSF